MNSSEKTQEPLKKSQNKAVIFDWGGVLIDNVTDSFWDFCTGKIGLTKKVLDKAIMKEWKKFERGKITEKEFWQSIVKKENKTPPKHSLWLQAFQTLYKEKKKMFNCVKQLKKTGYKTALLSNTESPSVEFFRKKKYDCFDTTIFSCEVGLAKPEKEIYELTLERLNINAKQAIFIDDTKENIEAAKALNMNTIHFTSEEETIKKLKTLLLLE